VHDVNLIQQRLERGKRAQAARLGEAPGVGGRRRENADKINVGAIDAVDTFKVQIGRKA
jgi:hypothetical protein